METHHESFLAYQFQEFYREVVRLKQRVRRGDWVFESETAHPARHDDLKAPSAVWQTLLTLLERQALDARRSGGDFAAQIYREAQYVMAALADEIFITLDWGGKESWQSNLLESQLFQSHRAGEIFFEKLDELLLRRDPVYLDLAHVYLMALALGFQGKFQGSPHSDTELANYRRKLFHFIRGRDPDLQKEIEHLFPEAYASTLDQGQITRVPYLRRWAIAGAVLILLWIAAGYPVWRLLTAELRPIIESILG